jgi:hypothetical protein
MILHPRQRSLFPDGRLGSVAIDSIGVDGEKIAISQLDSAMNSRPIAVLAMGRQ